MTIYYSPARKGFFDDAIHGPRRILVPDEEKLAELVKIEPDDEDHAEDLKRQAMLAVKEIDNPDCRLPSDAIEVSAERHAELIAELANGKVLASDDDGQPVAVDPQLSVEEQLEAIRRQRDKALKATDWTQMPDAMSAAKRKLWADHRQALRDLPALVEKALKAGKRPPEFPLPPESK